MYEKHEQSSRKRPYSREEQRDHPMSTFYKLEDGFFKCRNCPWSMQGSQTRALQNHIRDNHFTLFVIVQGHKWLVQRSIEVLKNKRVGKSPPILPKAFPVNTEDSAINNQETYSNFLDTTSTTNMKPGTNQNMPAFTIQKAQRAEVPKKRKRRSPVWQGFEDVDDSSVRCIFCNYRTRPNYSSSLSSHLSQYHKVQYVQLLESEISKRVAVEGSIGAPTASRIRPTTVELHATMERLKSEIATEALGEKTAQLIRNVEIAREAEKMKEAQLAKEAQVLKEAQITKEIQDTKQLINQASLLQCNPTQMLQLVYQNLLGQQNNVQLSPQTQAGTAFPIKSEQFSMSPGFEQPFLAAMNNFYLNQQSFLQTAQNNQVNLGNNQTNTNVGDDINPPRLSPIYMINEFTQPPPQTSSKVQVITDFIIQNIGKTVSNEYLYSILGNLNEEEKMSMFRNVLRYTVQNSFNDELNRQFAKDARENSIKKFINIGGPCCIKFLTSPVFQHLMIAINPFFEFPNTIEELQQIAQKPDP